MRRLGHPSRLETRGQHCDKPCRCKRRRAITTKLRATRHLPAYAADLAERSVQVIHGSSLCIAKYAEAEALVNTFDC